MLQEVTINVFFFFQAEDGIRDHCVTGVQTCALPIWPNAASMPPVSKSIGGCWAGGGAAAGIGRASCRERVEISVVAVSLKKKNKAREVRPESEDNERDHEPGHERHHMAHLFFFQAEDGIRDHCVTGVQTCALPISIHVLVLAQLAVGRDGLAKPMDL